MENKDIYKFVIDPATVSANSGDMTQRLLYILLI